MTDVRVNRRGVTEQHRGPLAGVSADEAVKVFKSHAGRPLVEWAGLTGLVSRSIVIFPEPGGTVSVLQQDLTDSGSILRDDAVVAGESGRHLRNHAEADRVVVAAGDEGGAGRRAQRRRMEIRVAQSVR